MKPETMGPMPVPASAEPLYRAIGVFRSSELYISDTTPPTMVANVEAPAPTKNRAASIPPKLGVVAHAICPARNMIAEPMKTGRRPLISENGARNIGEIANPVAQVVTPVSNATSPRCHFARWGIAAIEYEPALYAAENVHQQHNTKMVVLWAEDQVSGDSYFFRLGGGTVDDSSENSSSGM